MSDQNYTPDPPSDDVALPQDHDRTREETKSPSIVGKEDVLSQDVASSEPADIDEELDKVGLRGDEEGVKPLRIDEDLD